MYRVLMFAPGRSYVVSLTTFDANEITLDSLSDHFSMFALFRTFEIVPCCLCNFFNAFHKNERP